MIIKKITPGFVIQTFDTKKKQYTHQEFIAGSEVDYENTDGDPVDPVDSKMQQPDGTEPYLPFDMLQPSETPFAGQQLGEKK